MIEASRRAFLAGAAATPVFRRFAALSTEPDAVVPLWPAGVPGATVPAITEFVDDQIDTAGLRNRFATHVTRPTLSYFPPPHPTGAAALIIPGGGYRQVGIDHEGYEVARWMTSLGVASFVLRYRLPVDRWAAGPVVALQDAQRAIRLIRHGGGRWKIDPTRVTVFGASAGGHLAGSLTFRFSERTYPAVDIVDRLSARPDGLCLLYPVVSMSGRTHAGSRRALIGEAPSEQDVRANSLELNVPSTTPPTLLVHSSLDRNVPVDQSLLLYQAVRATGGSADLHIFQEGDHGVGLRADPSLPIADWPAIARQWQERNGLT